jgi:hypothetical protein
MRCERLQSGKHEDLGEHFQHFLEPFFAFPRHLRRKLRTTNVMDAALSKSDGGPSPWSAFSAFKAWTASSTPSSSALTCNGKPAPSSYLHKQLDVTLLARRFAFLGERAYSYGWKLLCRSVGIGEAHQWAKAHFLVWAHFDTSVFA